MNSAATQAVIFDIGGVLLDGDAPMPGARDALERLRRANIPFLLLTNTTRRSHAELYRALRRADFDIRPEQLLTPARAASAWLRGHEAHALLLIHPGLADDFADSTMVSAEDEPDGREVKRAVVVGDAGDFFTYAALNRAFRALMNGATLLSLSDSRYFREQGALSLDAGPFVRLLEEAAGASSIALGKPGAAFFQQAIAQLGVGAENITLIGDDIGSDILGADAMGLKTILVQTGKYSPGDAEKLPPGARQAADVSEAVAQILAV